MLGTLFTSCNILKAENIGTRRTENLFTHTCIKLVGNGQLANICEPKRILLLKVRRYST